MSALFGLFPFLLKLYADGGHQGQKFQQGLKRVCDQINVEIVKRNEQDVGLHLQEDCFVAITPSPRLGKN